MRRTGEIPEADVTTLIVGLDFLTLIRKGDFAAFAAHFLMREEKEVHGRVIYDRYRALGGNPNYIRSQLHMLRTISGHLPSFPGHLPPFPNQRERVQDSNDDDDADREREVPPVDGGQGDGEGDGAAPTFEQLTQDSPVQV